VDDERRMISFGSDRRSVCRGAILRRFSLVAILYFFVISVPRPRQIFTPRAGIRARGLLDAGGIDW
jgi:hypothetical protein